MKISAYTAPFELHDVVSYVNFKRSWVDAQYHTHVLTHLQALVPLSSTNTRRTLTICALASERSLFKCILLLSAVC